MTTETREERYARLVGAGWIGVDLDGTLAIYTELTPLLKIGEPIPPMVDRVKRWIAEGHEVRIMTARMPFPIAGATNTCAITLMEVRGDEMNEAIGTSVNVYRQHASRIFA